VCGLFLWQISGQQSARERAEELGRWLYTTLGSIGDAVIATDETGRIAFMNEVAARLTGWPIDEAHGRPLGDVFRLVHQNKRSALESSGRTAGPTTSALLVDRAGKEIAVEDTAAPIRSRSGETLGVVLAFRDVGQKREAEQRAWFLSHASLRLAESLDYQQTLDTIAELAVPDIADWCAIDLLDDSGQIIQAAIAHRDPEKIEWVRELNRRFPTSRDARAFFGHHR
jgi:PAS domain S-box-containing protein